MSDTSKPDAEGDRLHVLRRGEMLGPFTPQELSDAFDRGEIAASDFVQTAGTPLWQPLAVLLPEEEAKLHGVVPPDWKFLGVWIGRRLRSDFLSGAPWLGAFLVFLGTLIFLLTRWPLALWVPFFAGAVLVSIVALVRGKIVAGLGLLVAAGLGPVMISFLLPHPPALVAIVPAPEAALPPALVAARATPPAVPPPVIAPPVSALLAVAASTLTARPNAVPPLTAPSFPSLGAGLSATPTPAATPALVVEKKATPKPAGTPAAPLDLVQKHHDALLLVGDAGGAGSGFICLLDGVPRAVTNIHVLAGMQSPEITRLQGTTVKLGVGEAAVGRDIFRIALSNAEPSALEVLNNLEEVAHIGDDIVVLGNSGGGGVVTKLEGKLVGIGPDRIEVSAEFIPGNSGSPIIHVPTGKVIGIATYLTRRYEEWAGASAPKGAPVIRRFGYRMDAVKRWEPVNWRQFQAEAMRLKNIGELTEDVFDFLDALRNNRRAKFTTETLKRPALNWLGKLRGHLSEADRLHATQSFLGNLRSMARADVSAAETQLGYDYFRRELKSEQTVREKLYKSFDSESQDLSRPNETAY